LIAGAIAALLVIVDDLIVAFRGGESVIADFFESWLGIDIQPVLQDMVDAVMWGVGVIGDLFGGLLATVGGIMSAIGAVLTGDFDAAWDHAKNAVMVFGETISNYLQSVFSAMPDWITKPISALVDGFDGAWEGIKNGALSLIDTLTGYFSGLFDWITGKFDWISDTFSSIGSFLRFGEDEENAGPGGGEMDRSFGPFPNRPSTTNNNNNVNQDVRIDIRTNDPERAGRAVQDGLQRQLDSAGTQSRRGGF
jgi:hypothetical protein